MPLRRVQPELLDTLPHADPRARRSRRDLRRVNAWMGQSAIMARLLRRYGPTAPATILDPGCGDGTFMLQVARRLAPIWPNVRLSLVDRQKLVAEPTIDAYAALGWTAHPITADVFDALAATQGVDIIAPNLFLHHFEPAPLRALLAAIVAKSRFVAACEPRRARLAQYGSRLLFAIGCNAVTRHDAVTSVQAGFDDQEISALWPALPGWRLEEAPAGLFTHTLTAQSPA